MTRAEAAGILGVSPKANEVQIKKAFRKKAMLFHPDRNDSPNARAQFIEIHEAYEYLSDLVSGRTTESYSKTKAHSYSSNQGPRFRSPHHKHRNYTDPYSHMSREEFEARYERARKAAEDTLNRKSEAIYQNSLDEYQNTWRKKFAKIMAIIGIVLCFLFTTDYFLGTTTELVPNDQVEILTINDGSYDFRYLNIHHVKYDLFTDLPLITDPRTKIVITRTYIFKDILKIKASLDGYSITFAPRFSSYTSFPIIPILLIIPFISLFFERPKFNFVFLVVNYNIYVFPILVFILMLHDGRLLRLFGL
jgi:hypothetical protein